MVVTREVVVVVLVVVTVGHRCGGSSNTDGVGADDGADHGSGSSDSGYFCSGGGDKIDGWV